MLKNYLFLNILPDSINTIGQTLIDRIVVVVDKEIITESELNERVTFLALQTASIQIKKDYVLRCLMD